jgi:hypothetical protein
VGTVKKLVIASLFASLFVLGAACSKKGPPPTEPTPGTSAATGEPAAPTTAEECESAGYQVVGDIGDGQVKCPEGTTEISRIQYGIEGGVCCSGGPADTAPAAP